jgi:lysozyme
MNDPSLWVPIAKPLTQKSESCKLLAYADPSGHGPWTIGWGHTSGVLRGQTCSQAQADAWLDEDLLTAAVIVANAVHLDLAPNQGAALTDFVYNVGPGGYKDGFVILRSGQPSTMLRLINAGSFALAAEEFLRWNLPAELPGLQIRRQAERALFLKP